MAISGQCCPEDQHNRKTSSQRSACSIQDCRAPSLTEIGRDGPMGNRIGGNSPELQVPWLGSEWEPKKSSINGVKDDAFTPSSLLIARYRQVFSSR